MVCGDVGHTGVCFVLSPETVGDHKSYGALAFSAAPCRHCKLLYNPRHDRSSSLEGYMTQQIYLFVDSPHHFVCQN